MRSFILAFALTATGCSTEEEPTAAPGLTVGTFRSGERDALCIAGAAGAQRAGFIVYTADHANCSASGRIEQTSGSWTLLPAGDADCKIPMSIGAGRVSLGTAPPSCAYYCGPGAGFAGKSFNRSLDAKPATDLAGESLC